MLNSHLIEYMGAVHRQQRSGVLTVIGPGYHLRFCFEGGDPVALDLGVDKELIIADELAAQHKIDAEGHGRLVEQYRAGAGTVTDLVRNGQMASDDEIAAATRGTVESTLLRCFGTMHYEASFAEGATVDDFNFTTSAVRLRIATPQLLSTVQPRVAEFERITTAVAPNAVFGLDENSEGGASLSDVEKQILDWVDGRRTVEEIAVGIRDSTFNLSRVLLALVEKHVIRQTHVAVAQPALPMPPSVRRSASEEVFHAPVAPPSSRLGLRIAVPFVLLLLLAIVWGLSEGRQAAEGRNQRMLAIKTSVTTRAWSEAMQQVADAEKAAGNDLVASEAARQMQVFLDAEMQRERQEILALIDKAAFDQARERLGRLPQDAETAVLGSRLKQAADEATERSAALRERVGRALQGGRVADALAEYAQAEGRDQIELGRILDVWRDELLAKASRTAVPFGERGLLAAQVAAGQPTATQLERLRQIRADLDTQRRRLVDLLADLAKRSESGAWLEVTEAWTRERIPDQVHGSDLATEADRVRQGNDRIREELTGLQESWQGQIRDGDDPQRLRAGVQALTGALAKRPKASNAAVLGSMARLLADVAGCIREDAASEELKALSGWLADHAVADEGATAVRARINRIEEMEKTAADTLERARAFARQDSWEQARRVLEDMVARSEWRKTRAYATAVVELNAARNLQSQRQAWRKDLEKAMEKGDGDQALAIARKMGLKYLPLRIETIPAGATVQRDGQDVGRTPLTIDIPASERGGLRFALRRDGFMPQQVEASSAEAGWRIRAYLEREPAARQELNLTLTMRPLVAEGRIWSGNRQTLVAIAPTATDKVRQWTLDAGSADLSQPLYARPALCAGAIWLPTREGLALQVGLDAAQGNIRIPLTGRSDHALALHVSSYVVGRRFLIAAGHDGVLRAVDVADPATIWTGSGGAPFVTAPWLAADDQVAILRRDGRLERCNPDDGRLTGSDDLRAPVVSAWIGTDGIQAYAGGWLWRWDGKSLHRTEIPAQPVVGGAGVFIAGDGHVFLRGEQEWKDMGRIDGAATADPVRWAGHAVIPQGRRLMVMGPVPFVAEMPAEILDPVVMGDQLVVPMANGLVLTYKP